jgi:TRAP-type C4-dicarboxylate transport system substrate-binding protein
MLSIGPLTAQIEKEPSRKILRISLENTPTHVMTRNVSRFAEEVSYRLSPRVKAEVYPDARLFRDREVLNAVHSGKVEMAVAGTWNLEPYMPELNLFLLPLFYGKSVAENHQLSDGTIGRRIEQRMESLYEIRVLGKWMDLGHAHVFTLSKPITRLEDFKGLRIRVAGGKANELRFSILGAYSFTIPWPELVERLRSQLVDGILTTYETIRSAELWNHGIRYAFEDNQYFPMYIPIIQKKFWEELTEEERTDIRNLWDAQAEKQRREALEAQVQAKEMFIQNKGKVFEPGKSELDKIRKALMRSQADLIRQLKIDRDLVEQAEKELEP